MGGFQSGFTEPRFPFLAAAQMIPYRSQQVLISWIFIVASTALLLDFIALQLLVEGHSEDNKIFHYGSELCNWFGVLSCFCWFLGFLLLVHWLKNVGATPMGLFGAQMKLVAAVFFNLQPMTGTMNDPLLGGSAGLWWSNATGITLFHLGNIVSCIDFAMNTPPGADKRKGWFFHGNLPITGMWIYQLATWFLVGSNYLSCRVPGASWAPVVPLGETPVPEFQVLGAFFLLVGSIFYTVWCAGFHNFSHPPVVPLTNEVQRALTGNLSGASTGSLTGNLSGALTGNLNKLS